MTNTGKYRMVLTDFKKALDQNAELFQQKYARLERYKDSEFYASDKAAADRERDEKEKAIRDNASTALSDILKDMETELTRYESGKTLIPPSAEQLCVLQALQMRATVTKDELQEAAKLMAGCPLAERVCADVGKKHSIAVPVSKEVDSLTVRESIRSLAKNGGKFIREIEGGKARDSYIADRFNLRTDLFFLDQPLEDDSSLSLYGVSGDVGQFAEIVNGV